MPCVLLVPAILQKQNEVLRRHASRGRTSPINGPYIAKRCWNEGLKSILILPPALPHFSHLTEPSSSLTSPVDLTLQISRACEDPFVYIHSFEPSLFRPSLLAHCHSLTWRVIHSIATSNDGSTGFGANGPDHVLHLGLIVHTYRPCPVKPPPMSIPVVMRFYSACLCLTCGI
jgi:hypothetical protein